jgi:type IV pilus assembly protein PilC
MATYTYIAKDRRGNRCSGTYHDVDSVAVLRRELEKLGYTVVKATKSKLRRHQRQRISDRDVIGFIFQFGEMYSAGLSVLQCLETLEEQVEHHGLRGIITDIREQVAKGASLRNAFARHERVFSTFMISMLDAGETGAKLGESLELSAQYLEKRLEMRSRVRSAFLYPTIVAVVAVLVIGSLLAFVVPMFEQLYGKLQVQLPLPTQILIMLSAGLRRGWYLALLVGGLLAVGCWRLLQRPDIQSRIDRLKLTIPVFGHLHQLMMVSRFLRTLAMLLSVGVPLIRAFEVARDVVPNRYWIEITDAIRDAIRSGNSVAKALREHAVFPAVVVRMADSGEQAGVLPSMLNKAAVFLDKDIDRLVNSLLTKLEPGLTLLLGGVIGLILMGVYLPMLDYMSHLK